MKKRESKFYQIQSELSKEDLTKFQNLLEKKEIEGLEIQTKNWNPNLLKNYSNLKSFKGNLQ